MVLSFIEGFDTSRVPAYATFGTGSLFDVGRTGTGKSWQVGASSGFTTTSPTITITPPSGTGATVNIGAAVKFNSIAATPSGYSFFSLREGGTSHLVLRRDPTTFNLLLCRGDGTLMADSGVPYDPTVWNYIEVSAVINDTTGSVKVALNGVTVINLTAVDTKNGATGVVNTLLISNAISASTAKWIWLDDFYWGDTSGAAPHNGLLGDVKVLTLKPVATGASSVFVGSDGDSINNWDLVDDDATTTDYVGSATSGARDYYDLTDLPAGSVPLATQTSMLAAKSDVGAPAGDLLIARRSSGGVTSTSVIAPAAALTTSFQWFEGGVNQTDPNGDPWTLARANGLQIGPGIA